MNGLLPFEWIAAIRFLREGRLQSIFIIVGAAIGVAVIVFMSALLDGLQANLFKRVLSSQPHIVLQRPQQVAQPQRTRSAGGDILMAQQKPSQRVSSIDQWQKVRDDMQQRPDVMAVSPSVTGPAFVLRGDASQAISLIGIDPEQYIKIVPLPDKITAGSYRMTNADMLIGIQLADDLGVQLGDKLRVTTASGGNLTLTIAGLFDLGSRAANQRNAYVLLSTAQNLTGLIGGVSTIDLTVRVPFDAELVAQSIASETGLQALSWIATNNQFFLGLNAQKYSSQMIRLFVGLSVAAGIASVLVVSVVQRSKEIGILRAMGGSRGQVMRIFLIQGGIVGLLGSVLGSLMAAGLLTLWRLVAKNPDGTPMFIITVSLQLFLMAALLATLTGLAAAVTPALRAARMQPVEAIRG
ncbi:ABC transporter permease [Actimicrobium antarcticum]|uniref:FtsX-like permease family protein n=1 Tax=Actimicrobium antarcticum TaxID=1051899 RepID=A0ABP7SPQ0_9BURK